MAIYPGAIYRPVTGKGRRALTNYNRVNLHVAVSESKSLFHLFNNPKFADSHFYVRKDGKVEQYVDTKYRAFADVEGNDGTISIETQGGLRNPQGEPWTAAQVETLAEIYAWAVRTHGVKVKIASNSKVGTSSHGLSWHRLGIDGNFPSLPDVRAGRLQRGGGMHYSHSRGKLCPGDAKIRQVDDIFRLAQDILDDKDEPKPSPGTAKPTPIKRSPKEVPVIKKRLLASQQKLNNPTLVKYWQQILRADGFPAVEVDGKFGTITERATKYWQKRRNLKADGVVGENTWTRALLADPDGRLKRGDRGPHVKVLQYIVKVKIDGVFGSATETAVKQVQRWFGIKADGVAGADFVSAYRKKA